MSDYRYSTYDKGASSSDGYREIDLNKLQKLDKLLVKIDNDLKKRQKEITKPVLVETLKKTHEIYQIVLYEVSEMLEAAKLSDLRQILTKIYNGQNNILNYILKLNTNFEVNADQMLQNLTKTLAGGRRKSFGSKDVEEKQVAQMATTMVAVQPAMKKVLRKTFKEKATDTGEDMKDARSATGLAKKEEEIKALAEELDEEGAKIDEFLKNRKAEMMAVGESKAQNNLRDVLKDLGKKRREADQVEDDANNLAEMQHQQKNQMSALQGSLIDGLKGMQKAAQDKALDQVKSGKAVYKNGQLVYLESIAVETEKDYFESEVKERFDKFRREAGAKDQKNLENEKRLKDMALERDVLQHQIQELTQRLNNVTLEKKKQEEKIVQQKKADPTLSKQDTEKIKRLVEDNIKMKLRIKTLLDSIKDLEAEINRNFDRFKQFVMNSNLPEDMKKALLAQAEQLLKPNLSNRLNLNDLKELMNTESEFYKDPLFKNLIGSDISALTRAVKRDEQQRKAKIAKIPGYDPMFDVANLEPDEQIITRKVKRMVERMNSRGEMVTEEIEVEEEVIINSKTGEEVRKRDKPQIITQSQNVKTFLDAHGGFAIGGSKIQLPKRPMAKDGTEAKVGQWFEDKDGKKVRMMKGQEGEEVFEIEEQYVDENGVARSRVKQMKIKKDKNGNEVVEEEIVGADGKKQVVQKRVFKDKDGAMVTEEVITDHLGNKVVKRQKVTKDKDGNEVIVEEIVDQFGNKTTVRRKVVKDANGNDVVIEERIDANGNKIITTIRKDEFGQEIVEEVIVDRHGNTKRVEKQVVYDSEGNAIVQEVTYDESGNKITKQIRMRKDQYGNEYKEEVITDEHGNQKTVLTKVVKDKDGRDVIEETIINADGTTTTMRRKVYRDKDGNEIIEEETVDSQGNKVVTKTKRGKNGEEIVEETRIGADGKPVKVVRQKKLDKNGNLVTEETTIGTDGKATTVVRQKKIDKDGNEIIEETITNADGTKTVVRKKVYRDKDGNEIIEEEKIDQNGNKVVTRTKRGKNGEETVEETRMGPDGKTVKVVRQTKKDKNGNTIVEETTIGADGKKTVKILKQGVDDKNTQTDAMANTGEMTLDQMLDKLAAMGVDKSKLDQLRNQIMLKQKIQQNKQQKKEDDRKGRFGLKYYHRDIEEESKEDQPGGRNASADSGDSLETLEEENDQNQAEQLYNKMMQNKFGGMADLIRQVRNQLGKQGNEKITLEEFQEYLLKMKQVHQKCGENCPHLRRFYEKLGFVQRKYKRRFLRMKDTKIEAKKKLPQIQTPKI